MCCIVSRLVFVFFLRFSTISFQGFSQVCGSVIYTFKDLDEERLMHLHYNDSKSISIFNKLGMDREAMSQNNIDTEMKNGSLTGIVLNIKEYDSIGKVVFRDFDEKTIICRETKFGKLPPFCYTDNWLPLNWIISKRKTKMLLGYRCRSAKVEFRGRKYTAWFADSIPLPFGPWKLYGLPGLILYAYDEEKKFVFKATSVSLDCSESLLGVPRCDSVKSIEEFIDYRDNLGLIFYKDFEKHVETYNQSVGRKAMSVSGFENKSTKWELRQKRIERKYEFEVNGYRFNSRNVISPDKDTTVEKYHYDRN